MRQYVAFLRAIAHVPMLPFREALEGFGFTHVASYGMSGNLFFNAAASDVRTLEARIAERLGTASFVRTRKELERIVTRDPFRGHQGAATLFLAHPVDGKRRSGLAKLDFEAERPHLWGRTVFFVHPSRLRGKRTPVDFERVLGTLGTARSSRVVAEILKRMSEPVAGT